MGTVPGPYKGGRGVRTPPLTPPSTVLAYGQWATPRWSGQPGGRVAGVPCAWQGARAKPIYIYRDHRDQSRKGKEYI
eukprot:6949416-Pyramimonas_sp.AAC.1